MGIIKVGQKKLFLLVSKVVIYKGTGWGGGWGLPSLAIKNVKGALDDVI